MVKVGDIVLVSTQNGDRPMLVQEMDGTKVSGVVFRRMTDRPFKADVAIIEGSILLYVAGVPLGVDVGTWRPRE